MHAVTIRAYRDVLVTLRTLHSVHTRVIERELIGTEGGIESLHAAAICMARAAQLCDLPTRNVTAESGSGVLGPRHVLSIATVAGRTTHPFVAMHTGGGLIHDHPEVACELGVTIDAD